MLEIQTKTQWQTPVPVALGADGKQMVKGPHDALALLAGSWPYVRGVEFVRARSLCRAALDGRKSMEEARLQFQNAVNHAEAREQ